MGKLAKLFSAQAVFCLFVGYFSYRLTQPHLAQALFEPEPQLAQVDVEMTKNADEFSQIQLVQNGQAKVITTENTTHSPPEVGDNYIVWTEEDETGWNVMLFDRRTQQTVQLTHLFQHSTPQTLGAYVTWVSHQNDQWAITLYDGRSLKTLITAGQALQDLGITPLGIVFTQMSEDRAGWKLQMYAFSSQQIAELDPENLVGDVKVLNQYEGSRVAWKTQSGMPKHLQLIPFKMPPVVAREITPIADEEEEVLEEIVATESAEIQEATPEAVFTPEPIVPDTESTESSIQTVEQTEIPLQ